MTTARPSRRVSHCDNCGGGPQFGHQTWCGTAPGKAYARNPVADTAALLAELDTALEHGLCCTVNDSQCICSYTCAGCRCACPGCSCQ